VRDQRVPEKEATARVRVTIQRDRRTPRFQHRRYTSTLDENVRVDTVVEIQPARVQAQDEDKRVNILLNFEFGYLSAFAKTIFAVQKCNLHVVYACLSFCREISGTGWMVSTQDQISLV